MLCLFYADISESVLLNCSEAQMTKGNELLFTNQRRGVRWKKMDTGFLEILVINGAI